VKSFFGVGLVAHVSMAHPVCSRLGNHIEAAALITERGVVRHPDREKLRDLMAESQN
jgi:hypothetical protein